MKKPKWVVQKEQQKKAASQETIWLFGLHAVQDALKNPKREKLRLVVSPDQKACNSDQRLVIHVKGL